MTDFPTVDLALASLKPFLKVDFPTLDLAPPFLKVEKVDFPTVDLAPPFLKVDLAPPFLKVDNEQILSELFEEIDLKRECVHLLKKLNAVVGEPRKELIRILRLKRDRLKVLNPSLFTRAEFDKEHEKIISDVVLKCECGPL
jgi:hypothetical protein